MSATKLYLPYGEFGDMGDREHVWYNPYRQLTFHWFRVGRETPLASYQSLIMGYRNLTPAARIKAQETVDEFLSETEYRQLREYLRTQHGKDLRITILTAPVEAIRPDASTKTGTLRPYGRLCGLGALEDGAETDATDEEASDRDDGDGDEASPVAAGHPNAEGGFFKLSEEKGYSLPFVVWGYYAAVATPASARRLPPVRPFSPPLPPLRPGR